MPVPVPTPGSPNARTGAECGGEPAPGLLSPPPTPENRRTAPPTPPSNAAPLELRRSPLPSREGRRPSELKAAPDPPRAATPDAAPASDPRGASGAGGDADEPLAPGSTVRGDALRRVGSGVRRECDTPARSVAVPSGPCMADLGRRRVLRWAPPPLLVPLPPPPLSWCAVPGRCGLRGVGTSPTVSVDRWPRAAAVCGRRGVTPRDAPPLAAPALAPVAAALPLLAVAAAARGPSRVAASRLELRLRALRRDGFLRRGLRRPRCRGLEDGGDGSASASSSTCINDACSRSAADGASCEVPPASVRYPCDGSRECDCVRAGGGARAAAAAARAVAQGTCEARRWVCTCKHARSPAGSSQHSAPACALNGAQPRGVRTHLRRRQQARR